MKNKKAKNAGFYARLPVATIKEIRRRANVLKISQGQVVHNAVLKS